MSPSLRPVRTLFLALCAVVAVSVIVKALRPKEIVPWRTDFTAATEEGRRDHKPVFAYFTAVWCGPCQTMTHTTWADKDVEAALREFVPLKIDIDQHPDLADKYSVRAVPTFAVLADDGHALRQTDGAMPPADMRAWLRAKP
jgi:thioredoxin-like negative regulator of GroEL